MRLMPGFFEIARTFVCNGRIEAPKIGRSEPPIFELPIKAQHAAIDSVMVCALDGPEQKVWASIVLFMREFMAVPFGPLCCISRGLTLPRVSFGFTNALVTGALSISVPETASKFSSTIFSVKLFGAISAISLWIGNKVLPCDSETRV